MIEPVVRTPEAGTSIDLRHSGSSRGGSLEQRIIAATNRCVARWGVAKTTLDDIAREAGCSRATIYRAFPGGKDAVMLATWTSEVASFCTSLEGDLATAASLEDAVVTALTASCRAIATHDALQFLVEHEPGAVMPYLSFDRLDPLLSWVSAFAAPALARFVEASTARELGEWVARIVLSYAFEPTPDHDLTDPAAARRFVQTYVLPGVLVESSVTTASQE